MDFGCSYIRVDKAVMINTKHVICENEWIWLNGGCLDDPICNVLTSRAIHLDYTMEECIVTS